MAATTDPRLDAPAEAPEPGADDIEPVLHETRDRIVTGTVTVVPFLLLVVVGWQLWNALHWHDLVVFAIMYALTGLGVTVGFHRLFTHRSFKTRRRVRGVLAVARLGRDRGPGDLVGRRPPQAPRVLRPATATRTARTSTMAAACAARCAGSRTRTSGGCSSTRSAARKARYAPDLIKDPVVAFVDRTFVVWALGGLARAVRSSAG